MPTPGLCLPNVRSIKTITTFSRALQALAQPRASEQYLSTPTLNPVANHYKSTTAARMETNILPVDPTKLGKISASQSADTLIEEWDIQYQEGADLQHLRRAAEELKNTDTPVAFPTETVYGLGGDATRSSATRAIFAAKGRPADNPLIVHVHSIAQLRKLLRGKNGKEDGSDPMPEIYKTLIRKFWPGPLTMIMPNPEGSVLAPEVTAGLNTFGARMPRSILALALMRMSGVPVAAPSANASTRPSPTAAEHVKDDLDGRIHTIIDGGPCEVGVESTVVDGLSSPPTILRPGGVTVEQLRQCEGWESVVVGYKDASYEKGNKPRAPGMKYRHYSPKATVILYEVGSRAPSKEDLLQHVQGQKSIGIVRTTSWPQALGLPVKRESNGATHQTNGMSPALHAPSTSEPGTQHSNLLKSMIQHQIPHAEHFLLSEDASSISDGWDINLGANVEDVARGLFSALRELDKKGVDIIFVEGIDDTAGNNIATAVMNRVRKAAEVRI
ncbi:translation initiation protein Sua5 [Lophiotrema nucula]|uniref:Threonylcarbamoyl-AMP synthase n=1 Tax=Lophiotrema nucula TaxID=690887 RepID=A0A6A5Z774_9PLEO|nr:translation initiation protein Sua5 [Lophiotrema nucula]